MTTRTMPRASALHHAIVAELDSCGEVDVCQLRWALVTNGPYGAEALFHELVFLALSGRIVADGLLCDGECIVRLADHAVLDMGEAA